LHSYKQRHYLKRNLNPILSKLFFGALKHLIQRKRPFSQQYFYTLCGEFLVLKIINNLPIIIPKSGIGVQDLDSFSDMDRNIDKNAERVPKIIASIHCAALYYIIIFEIWHQSRIASTNYRKRVASLHYFVKKTNVKNLDKIMIITPYYIICSHKHKI